MSTVVLDRVTKVFPDGTRAVDEVSLEIASGEVMVLLGPSGCGKSTLLRMIAGLEEATAGHVLMNGEIVDDLSPRERQVAMVFQDFALYPHMTVKENLGFPLRLSRVEEEELNDRVANVAYSLGIGDLLGRKPWQLSGGQRQRVAMGRAIIRRPSLFLMDEPLSNLDSGLRHELRAEISNLVREIGVTTIYVTHDQIEALTMADRVAIMRRGVLQDVGTPDRVYSRPATMYVAAFLGSPRINLLEAYVDVHIDRWVTLRVGEQVLVVPWTDYRTRPLAHYHGERIVVGIRAEALTPVSPQSSQDPNLNGRILHGRIKYFEHLGHESVAYVEIGGVSIAVDEVSEGAYQDGLERPNSFFRRLGGIFRPSNRASEASPNGDGHRSALNVPTEEEVAGRHHQRRADLAVRLPAYPGVREGHGLSVAVDISQLHFFDQRGRRIDVGVLDPPRR